MVVVRAGVGGVYRFCAPAGEAAFYHAGDAQVTELATGEIRPDHLDGRLELPLSGVLTECLEEADLPDLHAFLCAPLVFWNDRQRACGSAGREHPHRCRRA